MSKYFLRATELREEFITDFTVYYKIPQIVFTQDKIPYNNFAPIHSYFFPPASVWLLRPLSWLPYNLSKLVWTIILMSAFLVSVYLIKKILKLSWLQTSFFLFLGSIMYPIGFSIMDGQINPLLLFVSVGAYYAFTQEKDILAGLLLAFGVVTKISPALLLIYFLWRRQYKIFWSGVFFVLVFSGLAEVVLPKEGVGSINWYYLRHVIDDVSKQGGFSYNDQSLLAFLLRVRPFESVYKNVIDPLLSSFSFKLLTLQRFYTLMGFSLVGLVTLVVGWCSRTSLKNRLNQAVLVDYSILSTVALVGTGLTWYHQYSVLFFPWVVAVVLLDRSPKRKLRGVLLAILSLVFVFWAYNLKSQFKPFRLVFFLSQEAPLLLPVMLYGAVGLVGVLLYLRLSKNFLIQRN